MAVDIPDSLKSDLHRLEQAFADHASALKWTAESLFHITVRFLGDVAPDRLADVETAVRHSASQVQPFRPELSRLGAFPNDQVPRILWIGLELGPGYDALVRLRDCVDEELRTRGFAAEGRSFSPHITLARTRDRATESDRRALGYTLQRLSAERRRWGAWEVRELIVMRSDPGHTGPRYTPVITVRLADA